MEGLPLIPGYTFHDPTIREYKSKQKFDLVNGFRVSRECNIGIGRRPIDAASCAFAGESDPVRYDPSLTYGRVREYGYRQFVPHHALFAQKCLCFEAFFRQGVFNSPDEHYRTRSVNIIYFLEDDTLSVMEPVVDDAGFKQGRMVKRGRIPKDTRGDFYHWKDLNVGMDLGIYGVAYRTVDCDSFTREFLNSQGIDVGDKEELPTDPYAQSRLAKRKAPTRTTPITDDSRRRFLEYDTTVLSFDAIWNDDRYRIAYFLTDDTIAVREIHKPNDGKDPVAMLLKRTKLPKNWKNLPSTYPGIYMERGDPEVVEYYTPKDLKIGDTIYIFGRRFFLYDCDAFTRKYYSGTLGLEQPSKIQPPVNESTFLPEPAAAAPPRIGFGSPEDTLASCLGLMPEPPKKNVIRQIVNFPKKLRYSMKMEAVHPEDEDRDFILEYGLSEGTILITELEKRNSGRRGGCFLKTMLVPKPGTGKDDPDYYTPEDFFVGARINIFNHRFVINGADLFAYRYIEANADKFCRELRDNMRNYFVREGLLQDRIDARAKELREVELSKCDQVESSELSKSKDTFFDAETCIRDLREEATRRYEGERAESTPAAPQSEELRLDSTPMEKLVPATHSCTSENEEKLLSVRPKKELKWADQIDEEQTGHPIIPCHRESPESKASTSQECTPQRYHSHRDKRFEVDQLMYENAIVPPVPPQHSSAPPKFERYPGQNTISMIQGSRKESYPL